MQRELKRQFQRQQNEILRAIREQQTAAVSANGQKAQTPIPSAGDLFSLNGEVTIFIDAFRRIFEDATGNFGQLALDDLAIGVAFDLKDPFVSSAINSMTIQFANDINRTTQGRIVDELRGVLDQAAEQGLSIPEIQTLIHDNISQVFDVRKSDFETERISRTEMTKASNNGTLTGWRQSGVVRGKAWLAALDSRTRDTHVAAHNQYQDEPIPLEKDFQVGGGFGPSPGQINAVEEVANCRCSMIAVLA